jgi:hypothetical protein
MTNDFRWMFSVPHRLDLEVFQAHQLTQEFREEVEYRQSFDHYCQWYAAISEQNRQELKKLQGDFNVLGWFYRNKAN